MSRGGREIGHDGLSDTERAVMALFDEGDRAPVIAIKLQLGRPYVERVIKIFSYSEDAAVLRDDRVRRASQQLAAACVATGSYFR